VAAAEQADVAAEVAAKTLGVILGCRPSNLGSDAVAFGFLGSILPTELAPMLHYYGSTMQRVTIAAFVAVPAFNPQESYHAV
jgi:hypothetical protein